MATKFKPYSFRPSSGGKLVTALSPDSITAADYTVKREFRRDLDAEIRREGYDQFWPNRSIPIGDQPFPNSIKDEPITGLWEARSTTGKTAVLAATPTKLYRYFGLENGEYVSTDPNDYLFAPQPQIPSYITPNTAPNVPPYTPYWDDSPGVWLQIGEGFSTNGHRWEAVLLNGYIVFNNGYDLPVTFRLEEFEVTPIYELREQGIASVGTIEEMANRILAADITEVNDLAEILTPVSSGVITAAQAGATYSELITAQQWDGAVPSSIGNIVDSSSALPFVAGMVGKTIRFNDGRNRTITAVVSPTRLTVDGPQKFVSSQGFFITQELVYSGAITGTQAGSTVTAGAPIFTLAMENSYVRFSDGSLGKITVFTDTQHVTVDTNQTVAAQEFRIVPPQMVITSSAPFFDADWVGLRILFANGIARRITDFVSTTIVLTNSDVAIASQLFSVENPDAYAPVAATVPTTRVQFRIINSEQDNPRGWAVTVNGSMTSGSQGLFLEFPSKSFNIGDRVLVTGAGPNGGNLIGEIIYIASIGTLLFLDTAASTTIAVATVQKFESAGSGVGSYDLVDDGSGILRIKTLRGKTLVVYKETSIILGTYTGNIAALFAFGLPVETSRALYFRWTLIEANSLYHLYAGRSSFLKFDATNQLPEILPLTEWVKNLFFENASIDDSDRIYSADNRLTKEISFYVPEAPTDKAIILDYNQETFSTSAEYFSAAATVKRPVTGIPLITEDWFVMGTDGGSVLRYGFLNSPNIPSGAITASQALTTVTASAAIFTTGHIGMSIQFADKSVVAITAIISTTQATVNASQTKTAQLFTILPAIWHRNDAAYTGTLQGGLSDWGAPYGEKDIGSYVLHLAGQSQDAPVTFDILGCRNPSEGAAVLGTDVIAAPASENLVPMWFREIYLQDRIIIAGKNNPMRIVGRTFQMKGVDSRSFIRRQD